jgi:hypothetical protein
MSKLLDLANLGVDIYQSQQLASISASQNELHMAHMLEGMTSGMEVEKRKLIMKFEDDFNTLDFNTAANASARSLARIRGATDSLDLTPSGFREFADMERAKQFNVLLVQWESWASEHIDQQILQNAKIANQYLFEDDDLEEYAALQYVKEKEDLEMSATGKVWGGLFLAGIVGMLFALALGLAIGDPTAENFLAEESDPDVEMSDAFLGICCGFSLVAILPFFKWFKVDGEMVKMAFSTSSMDEAKEVLKKGGGQEALDDHIANFGEMTSDEIIEERIRRLEFVGECSD